MNLFAGLLLIALISYILHLDAVALRRLNPDLYDREMKGKPASWAVLSFLLMIVTVPIYLFFRFRFLRKVATAAGTGAAPSADSDALRGLVRASGIVIVSFLLTQVYSIAVYPALLTFTPSNIALPQSVHLSIAGAVIFLGTVSLLKDRGVDFRRALYLTSDSPGRRGWLLLSFLCGVALASLVFLIQRSRTVIPETPLGTAVKSSTPAVVAQFLILAAVIAPFFEEVFFRGFVFDILQKTRGKRFAFGMVTAGFAIAHLPGLAGDWMLIGMIVLVAGCFTCIRLFSSTVVPSAVAHYSYNIGVFLIPALVLFATNPSFAKYTFQKDKLPVDTRITLLKQSIAEQPNNWGAYNSLAWLLALENRELPEALRLIDVGLSGSPDNLHFLDTKAEILFRLKRYDEAVAIETNVVKKAPDQKVYQEHLAKYQTAQQAEKAQKR